MDFYMNHKWIIYNYDWGISIEYPHIGKPMTIYESHPYWGYDWYENIGLSDDLNRKTLKFDGLKPHCFSIFYWPFEADLDGFDQDQRTSL